jgi:hypothetical protein
VVDMLARFEEITSSRARWATKALVLTSNALNMTVSFLLKLVKLLNGY